MDYKKTIEDNSNQFNDKDKLVDFINSYVNDSREVKELEDFIGEYCNNLVPVYNDDIIEKWSLLTECHESTIKAIGQYDSESIYSMMGSDLYHYYDLKLMEDYNKLLVLLED